MWTFQCEYGEKQNFVFEISKETGVISRFWPHHFYVLLCLRSSRLLMQSYIALMFRNIINRLKQKGEKAQICWLHQSPWTWIWFFGPRARQMTALFYQTYPIAEGIINKTEPMEDHYFVCGFVQVCLKPHSSSVTKSIQWWEDFSLMLM